MTVILDARGGIPRRAAISEMGFMVALGHLYVGTHFNSRMAVID